MTYDEIDPALRAFIGAWEAYRKLGFKSDDIFCEVAANPDCPPGHLIIFCLLKAQGKEFRIGVAFWPEADVEDLYKQLTVASTAMAANEVPQPDMDRIWQESLPYRNGAGFVLALQNKGFVFPAVLARTMS